ncbi:MAG: hypothetical protein ACFFEK_06340 [Candidatus Thorarchaeota archaeon]
MKENEEKERKLSFKCCIPREMSNCTDDELRLSMVTLKNAIMNLTVCMGRLERELKNRGAVTSILKNARMGQPQELVELATIHD